MIREHRKWMIYTYYHRKPRPRWGTTHLCALVDRHLPGMKKVEFPTMIVDVAEDEFWKTWSSSTRTKINRAETEGYSIVRGKELLPDILHIFNTAASQKKLKGHRVDDFRSRPWIECSAVYNGTRILCGHVWLKDEEEKRALLFVNATNFGNDGEESSRIGRAHYYLLQQDGLYLRAKGMNQMDLMGYEKANADPGLAGVYQWKAGTHGREAMTWHYYPWWFYLLRSLRKKIRG